MKDLECCENVHKLVIKFTKHNHELQAKIKEYKQTIRQKDQNITRLENEIEKIKEEDEDEYDDESGATSSERSEITNQLTSARK